MNANMWPKVITQGRPIPTMKTGCADIVGFGQDGVVILRNNFEVQTFNAVQDYGYNAGWRVEKHVRLVADLTGFRTGDIVGFGDNGVLVSANNGDNTFTSPVKPVLDQFGYNGGWRVEKHLHYLSDIRGIGRCDIVGFGDRGVIVSKNDGRLKFNPSYIALADFGYDAGGWRPDRHLRFMGDTTGNRLPDIVGFGEKNVYISRNNGNGTFSPVEAVINDFCYSSGGQWRVDQHPRFIADLTGDGMVDVIGFGNAGVFVSLNRENGSFGPVRLVLHEFGVNHGWNLNHPRFIADLTGDERGDIIGFGEAGVYVSYNNGNGTFQPAKLVVSDFGIQQGWHVSWHPRFLADLTGDGRADIIGFGNSQTAVAYNDGKGGFGPIRTLTSEFSHSEGKWSVDKTVRWLANLNHATTR